MSHNSPSAQECGGFDSSVTGTLCEEKLPIHVLRIYVFIAMYLYVCICMYI